LSFTHYLDRGASFGADADCLIQGDRRWTYSEAQAFSYRLGNKLHNLGLGRGHKASVLSSNDARAFLCVFGFARAGVTWVPANPRLNLDDNQYLLDTFDCTVLIFHSDFVEMTRKLRPLLLKMEHWICLDRTLDDFTSLDDWLADAKATPLDIAWEPEDVAVVAPTGGTTGRSKGVQLSHRNLLTMVGLQMMCLAYSQIQRPVNLAAAPLTHAAGFFAFAALARGGKIIILDAPVPVSLIEAIERYRVTEFFLPPTAIYRLLAHPGVRKHDFSSLRYFVYGAAPMSIQKLKEALQVFGPCMTQLFGQSEAPIMCTYLSPQEHFENGQIASDEVLSSCGRPTPLVQLRILDDEGREVAAGKHGEICVRGDLVMPGYYKRPDLTATAIVDGWLHTGDVGYKDSAGRVHICDRKKDMIISGGFNIHPQEIEQLIWSHPAVEDCAVVGVPDNDWGEAVKAVVQLKPAAHVDAAELIALCKKTFGSLKSPKSIDVVASLPRSPNGKVMKRELRDRYWAGHGRQI
jgi:acyl-CoA synthetase (AMP-forming)/AMP-acid ligase II